MSADLMGGEDRRSTASEPDAEADGGEGETEGRVPPGLPIFEAHRKGVLFNRSQDFLEKTGSNFVPGYVTRGITVSLSEDITIDPEKVCGEIEEFIRQKMEDLERNGLIIGLSGGLDSCVVATLSAKAVGKDKVRVIYMPEKDSDPQHAKDASLLAKSLGINLEYRPLTRQLKSFSLYRLTPLGFLPRGLKKKLVRRGYRYYEDRVGESPFAISLKGLKDKKFGSFLAKGNAYYRIKHRLRMVALYLTAERDNLIVVGCANRTEYLIGYFVKFGCDHAADIMPILNLYKSQIIMLAEYLEVPEKIVAKASSPDVLPGIDDEEAIGIPYRKLDLILLGLEKEYPLSQIMVEARASKEEIEKIKRLLERSRHMREIYVPRGLWNLNQGRNKLSGNIRR